MSQAPVPVPDQDTQPFWDATAEHRLVLQHCKRCDRWIWQPKPVCPRCQEPEVIWTEVSGSGQVASWTVVHPPVLAAFADLVPFVILLVELDQGVRMVGQLVDDRGELLRTDGKAEGLGFGSRVSLRWRHQGDVALPAWTLAEA